jgi:deazaflavin-dependent oxidoreductase (nitroreductase family)
MSERPGRVRLFLAAFFSRVMRTSLARRLVLPVFPPLQMWVWRVTRGRVNIPDLLVPSLILRHVGAKTGLARQTPLICWPQPDGTFLVAGSNWGQPEHPVWTANLLNHPCASVVYRRRDISVTAALIADDEREPTWAVLEAGWPGYREYERVAGRDVRIFRLTPRG